MKLFGRLIIALWLVSTSLTFAGVSITSYNMGQLARKGIDLVACTKKRVGPQIEAFFGAESPLFREKHFVLFIQEAWTKRVFKALMKATQERGYFMYPQEYSTLKDNGQITITNLTPTEALFRPYTTDSRAHKGMLYLRLTLEDGTTLGALNVHTTYSDYRSFSKSHALQFQELAEFTKMMKPKTDHFVIGGDFNAGPDMQYVHQKYDSAKVVWNEGFMPLAKENGMTLVTDYGRKTWDSQENSLVTKPTFLIRMVNLFTRYHVSWDQIDSTIDHILVSDTTEVKDHGIVFDKPVPMHCPGRMDEQGRVPLSDHYGVNALLNI